MASPPLPIRPDAFVGTAARYARFRAPYPERLLRDLVDRCGLSHRDVLVDIACGPGQLSVPLAPYFRKVRALDLEPEMIEEGKRQAAGRGAANISWSIGRAEEFSLPLESIDLITIGAAFHRLDQDRISSLALSWLKPGGCLATLGYDGIISEKEPWGRIAMDVVRKYSPHVRPKSGSLPPTGQAHDEGVLRRHGFAPVASHTVLEPQAWTVESIAGFFSSTSICSPHTLGPATGDFEKDLARALLDYDPSGIYRENLPFGFTLGRKPEHP